jgi:hypothetical protein
MTHTEAVRAAARGMNDYRAIKVGAGRSRDKLAPGQTVVTHMAPSRRSLLEWDPEHPERTRDLDWCYASNCEALMTGDAAPSLWLHGHIHTNRNYVVGHTRVVANPRGYPGLRGTRENPKFDPSLVVELEPRLAFGMRV